MLPAFLVLWIRKAVPEPEEWAHASQKEPSRIADLFGPALRRTTLVTLVVCGLSLSGHWAFTFWSLQQIGTLAKNELKESGKRALFASIYVVAALGLLSIAGLLLIISVAFGFVE